MAIVNEVITEFAFSGSVSPLHDYNASLGKSIGLLAGAAAGIVATTGAIAAFVTNTTQALDPMIQLSRTTDVAVESMQELGYAASVSGSDLNAIQSSVAGLSEKIGEAAQKGSEEFARLGISVRDANGDVKAADTILLELGERFNALGLSMAERRSFAQTLGIDPSLVQLLSKTSSEIQALRQQAREFGVVTTEQADAAASLNDSMATLGFAFDAIKNSIAVGLAPQFEDLTSGFTDFLAANKEVIAEGVTKVIEVITALAEAVVRLTPFIAGITAGFVAWKVASVGLAGVLGVIFSPVTLIVAGITALLLIVDDLIVALNGGKSVIADLFQEFFGIDIVPPLNAALDAFTGFLSSFLEAGRNVLSVFSELFSGVFDLLRGDIDGAGEHFMSFFTSVANIFKNGVGQLIDEVGRLAGGIFEALTGMDFSQAGQALANNIVDPIRETFAGLFDWLTGAFDRVAGLADSAASFFGFGDDDETSTPTSAPLAADPSLMTLTPVPSVSNTRTERTVRVEQNNQFNLPPGSDRRTADAVADRLQVQLDDAETQIGAGGL